MKRATAIVPKSCWPVLIPIVCGLMAMGLYIYQGGFGVGHGPLDVYILILLFPGIYFAMLVPIPEWMVELEFMYTVVPLIINVTLMLMICWLFHAIRVRKRKKD